MSRARPSAASSSLRRDRQACRVLAARGLADGDPRPRQPAGRRPSAARPLPRPAGAGAAPAPPPRTSTSSTSTGEPARRANWTAWYARRTSCRCTRRCCGTRPDVAAVVHAHPPDVVAADLAGIAHPPDRRCVRHPGHPARRRRRAGLPARRARPQPRVGRRRWSRRWGTGPVVLLRGHGLTSAAASVEQAVLQAVSVDRLARLSLRVVGAGGTLVDLPEPRTWPSCPTWAPASTTATAWRHELARTCRDRGGRP